MEGWTGPPGTLARHHLASWNAYVALFIVLTNGQPLLATLSIVGVVLSVHRMGFASLSISDSCRAVSYRRGHIS